MDEPGSSRILRFVDRVTLRLGAVVGALLFAAGAAAVAGAQPSASTAPLVGIWHACAEVGAGYCERWVLAADGRFEARAAQGGCGRLARRRGRWRRRGSTLVITETSRTRWIGGRCEDDALVGARAETTTHDRPHVDRLRVRECTRDERDRSPARCRRFGGTARWRLATDEPMTPMRLDAPVDP